MLPILKPIIYVWATLNVIDDMTMVLRVGRLGAVLVMATGELTLAATTLAEKPPFCRVARLVADSWWE